MTVRKNVDAATAGRGRGLIPELRIFPAVGTIVAAAYALSLWYGDET